MAEMNLGGVAAAPRKTCYASCGVFSGQVPIVGKTVEQAKAMLADNWQVPADAVVLKGKQQLDATYVFQEGDEVEFSRRSGEKGLV